MDLSGKSIAIYTCIIGGYDTMTYPLSQILPREFYSEEDNPPTCHFIGFNEHGIWTYDILVPEQEPKLLDVKYPCDPWIKAREFQVEEINKNIMTSVLFRSYPTIIEPLVKYDILIYVDGNVRIISRNFLSNFLAPLKERRDIDIIVSKHNERNCPYLEVSVSMGHRKYGNVNFIEQMRKYLTEGLKQHSGLYWNGLVAYINPSSLEEFHRMYTQELFSYIKNVREPFHPQGQVSFPYCLMKLNPEIHIHDALYYTPLGKEWGVDLKPHNRY